MVTRFINLCGLQMLVQDPKVGPEGVIALGYLDSVLKYVVLIHYLKQQSAKTKFEYSLMRAVQLIKK